MTIYSGFSHWKWWFSIVMLVYQTVDTSHCRSVVYFTFCQAKCWYLLWQALWAVGRWRGPWDDGLFSEICLVSGGKFHHPIFHGISMKNLICSSQDGPGAWKKIGEVGGFMWPRLPPRPFTGYSSLFPLRGHLFWVYMVYRYTTFLGKPCFVTYQRVHVQLGDLLVTGWLF